MSVAVAALNHEKAQLEDNANQKISALENQVLFVVAVKFFSDWELCSNHGNPRVNSIFAHAVVGFQPLYFSK